MQMQVHLEKMAIKMMCICLVLDGPAFEQQKSYALYIDDTLKTFKNVFLCFFHTFDITTVQMSPACFAFVI